MTRFLLKILPVFLFTYSIASAEQTHNNLIPNFRFFLNPALNEGTDAFSFMGELGPKNFRGNATYGRSFDTCQRFKLSGEYLTQKLDYPFSEGSKEKWVSQIGCGGAYQYLFASSSFVNIEANFAYSRAFNQHLSKKHTVVRGQDAVVRRRIAGSDAVLSYVGTTLQLWHCGFFSAGADYDWVGYNSFHHKKHVAGFGTSLAFNQQFGKSFHLVLETEFRKPFNFYQMLVNWNRSYSSWGITCGLYGNYTHGKHNLPNVATAGVQLGFSFGGRKTRCCRSLPSSECRTRISCDLSNWVLEPAFYSPIVLAITAEDKKLLPISQAGCLPPTSVEVPLLGSNVDPYSINTGGFFSSSLPLTFSATGLPPGSSIDPATGVISGSNPHDGIHPVTVTGTSSCGSTSQDILLSLF